MSIKALAERILEGNARGNRRETTQGLSMKPKEPESFHVSSRIQGNRETNLLQKVSETLAESDLLGRPWPSRFLIDMPAEDRRRLQAIEAAIDAAVTGGDRETLDGLLAEWRDLLLGHLH